MHAVYPYICHKWNEQRNDVKLAVFNAARGIYYIPYTIYISCSHQCVECTLFASWIHFLFQVYDYDIIQPMWYIHQDGLKYLLIETAWQRKLFLFYVNSVPSSMAYGYWIEFQWFYTNFGSKSVCCDSVTMTTNFQFLLERMDLLIFCHLTFQVNDNFSFFTSLFFFLCFIDNNASNATKGKLQFLIKS